MRMPSSGSALGLLVLLGCRLLVGGVAVASEPRVAVVVLPPQFVAGSGDNATAAAELACDQLARELEKNQSLRVVDRSQLDRILNERRLSASAPATIVSYDAMIRLEIDTVRPVPLIRLRVVDLSNGNPIVESQYPWSVPLSDGVVAKMVRQCRAKLPGLTQPGPKLLRVRLLEVENASKSARLEPLSGKLRETFDNALQRSNGILLVHHLEAQTAKEESLLLVMGLSQLAGGRQFVPQSNATIELRIREMDGVGKTFEQTHVEVAWRVRKGGNYGGEWATADAAVKDFDGLLGTAWAKCADTLGQASPQAAVDYLNEMALRRKQAQAELDAAPKGLDLPREQSRQRLAHIAAAAKLDPTWEEAAYRLVFATANAFRDGVDYDFDAREAGIYEALRYLQRFKHSGERRPTVGHSALFWSLDRFLKLRNYESQELTAKDRLALDALTEIIDLFIAGPPEELPDLLPEAMQIVYRGMALTGTDVSQRREWLDRVIRLGEKDASLATHLPTIHEKTLLDRKMRFRMHAAKLLAEEGDPKAAHPYIEELIPLMSAAKLNADAYIAEQARLCAEKMNDTDLIAKLNASVTNMVYPMRINWLNFHPLGMMPRTGPRPRANVQTMQYDKFIGASPLAACGGRMYCIVPGEGPKHKPRVGFIELDGQGRPAGKITLLPKQLATWPRKLLSKTVCKGKLYLGTKGEGLLEYDPGKGDWRTFGPEQGLPDWNVYTLLALDDGTLFCHGGGKHKQGFFCLVNPSTSGITLLRRLTHPKGRNPLVDTGLFPVWKTGDRIVGFIGGGALYTLPGLGAGEPVRNNWPTPQANDYHESFPDGMATVAGRRFLKCRDALREVDDDGKVLRTWPRPAATRITPGPKDLPGQKVLPLSDQPDLLFAYDYRSIAQDSSHIFFFDDAIILCFDAAADTWYGPLETEPWTCSSRHVSGRNGVWFEHNYWLVYLDTADFIAAARKAGRVITSEQFRRKRQKAIEASSPLEQAKWALSMRQFAKAGDLCASILAKDAKDVEALLMMGLLHESCCLNQPDKVMEYYGRLAAIENNSSAAFTGLVHQYRLHIEAKRYAEALRVGRLIEQRYPRNAISETLARYNRWLAEMDRKAQVTNR